MRRTPALLTAMLAAAPVCARTPVQRDRAQDASVDRGILTPHAQTLPKGDAALNLYQLVVTGLTGAPSDRFQVSGTAPAFIPLIGLVHVKGVVARSDRLVLSTGGALFYGVGLPTTVGGGPLLDVYLGRDGVVSLHGGAGVYLTSGGRAASGRARRSEPSSNPTSLDGWRDPMLIDSGVTARVNENVKLVGELKVVLETGPSRSGLVLWLVGARFHGPSFAMDVALAFPHALDGSRGEPIPFAAPSFRF